MTWGRQCLSLPARSSLMGIIKMSRINKFLFTLIWITLLIISTGCSGAQSTALRLTSQPTTTPTPIPTAVLPTATTSAASAQTGLLAIANSCRLINSNDLAHLFPPHNEIVRDPPTTGPVSHPPFSDAAVAGTETNCTFYDFHQPGQLAGWMYQVTYLIDVPDSGASQTWNQAWEVAKAKSAQPVSGLGDEAFVIGANLYIKVGDAYISFESTDTRLDEKTASGMQQLLAYEKQLAQSGLSRLQ